MSTSSAEEKRKISFKIESASKRRKDFLRSKWTDPDSALASAPPDPYYPLYSPQTQEQQAEDDAFDDQTTNDDEMVEHDLSAQRNLEDVIAKAIKLDAEAAKKDGTGLWDVVRKVKYSVPTDPRFVPMILEQQTDLTLSLVINLYDSGFSFDDQELTYQYSRSNQSVIEAVNYGILPGQLDGRLLAAEKQAKDREMMLKKEAAVAAAAGGDTANDGSDQKKRGAGSGTVASDPTPIVYYDGGVLVEVRDYRDGRGIFDPATSTVKPVAFKMFLREDSHSLFQFLDQDAKKFHRTRIAIEIASIMQRFPSVCLDPDPTAHKIASIINYNNNKYNIPVKANAARQRRRLVPVRRGPRFAPTIGAPMPPRPLPTPTKSHPPPPAPTSRLLSFLQQANHSSITQETLEKQQMKPSGSEKNSARRHYLPVPKDPDSNYGPKEAVPRIAGRYHFVMPVPTRPQQQQQPGQPPQPQPPGQVSDFIILEIKGSGTPPYEMYIASLRVGLTAKPVTLALGGPTAAQQFLNQFMKLETAASPEHLKMLQTLQQQAQQAQARAQQAAQQGPGGAPAQQGGNTTPQGAPGAQQGQAGTPTQPSAGTAKQAVPPLTIPSGGNGLNRPMPSPTGAPLAGQMFAGQPKQALPPGVQRAPSQPGGPMPTQTLPQPGGPATPTPPPLVSGLQNLRPAGGGTLPPHPNLKFNPGVPKGGPSPQQMALARNQQMSQHMNRPMGAGPYPPSAQPGAFPVAGQPKLAQQNPGMVAPTQPPMMQQQQPPTQQPVPLGAPGAQHLVGQQPIAAQPQTPPSSRPTTRQSSSKKRG